MTKLKEEIEKYYKLSDDELVNKSSKEVERLRNEEQKKKINGIKKYYESNKKLTQGQKESLVRFLSIKNTFNLTESE